MHWCWWREISPNQLYSDTIGLSEWTLKISFSAQLQGAMAKTTCSCWKDMKTWGKMRELCSYLASSIRCLSMTLKHQEGIWRKFICYLSLAILDVIICHHLGKCDALCGHHGQSTFKDQDRMKLILFSLAFSVCVCVFCLFVSSFVTWSYTLSLAAC